MPEPLTSKQENAYLALVDAQKEQCACEAEVIKEESIKTNAIKLVEKDGISKEEAEEIIRQRYSGDLHPGDRIRFASGDVTVAAVLADPEKYDNESCADPVEPEEGIGRAKFFANMDTGKPLIHSMLHGGGKYYLNNSTQDILRFQLDDIIQWIDDTDKKTVLDQWMDKTRGLSAVETDRLRLAVSNKTGAKPRPLSKDLKDRQQQWAKEDRKVKDQQKSDEFNQRGIAKIYYAEHATGEAIEKAARKLFNYTNPDHDLVLRHGSELVSVINARPTTVRMTQQIHDGGGEYPVMPILHRYTPETLRSRLEEVAVLCIKGKDETIYMKWPNDILKGISAQHQVPAKQLTGIVEHPYVDKNYQAVIKQGYDEQTGLFVKFDPAIGAGIMARPDLQDAAIAYNFLKNEVLADFPFASELDLVGAISAILTAVQRKLIVGDSGCPGYLFDAPTQSTGKTTLAQIISYSSYNRPAAATSWSDSDEELGKHILAILREGHSCVLFDNLPNGASLKSNELAKAMTGNSYSKRLLGENTTATVPSSVLWLFTGNNVTAVGDFNTRLVPIRLDARMADPDRRQYSRKDVGDWCRKRRGKIIAACLTIIMAGKDFKPDVPPTRYREWDEFVRLPLLQVTGIDIADLFDRNKAADPEFEGRRVLLEILYEVFGDRAVTAAEIRDKAIGESGLYCTEKTGLFDALSDIFSKGPPTSLKLGKWLGKIKDTIIGDYKLTATEGTTRETRNRQCWRVTKK